MRLREHKQKKWINMLIQFSLFVSSMPYCQAEFWYIESGLFLSYLPCPLNLVLQILSPFHFVPPCLQSSNDQSQPKPDAKWRENSFIIQMQIGPCEKVNITINFTWCKTQSLKVNQFSKCQLVTFYLREVAWIDGKVTRRVFQRYEACWQATLINS